MSGLNDNHKRRILATFQYIDKLLEESLAASRPAARPLFPRLIQDISPAQFYRIESCAEKMREQMARLMSRVETPPDENPTPASWALRTNLTYMDISLEDLYPERMRGYGEMAPDGARDLSCTLNEIRRLGSQLSASLSESRAPE
jgi:hypothetical protein